MTRTYVSGVTANVTAWLTTSHPSTITSGRRLAWLDALRGIAALGVVFDHLGYHVLQHVRHLVYLWFDPGTCGVFIFFLISGYIVPASLEHKGSVRRFWVSRIFRLYPLYLLAMGSVAGLHLAGLGTLNGAARTPETSALGSVLMLSNVLGVPNAISQIWTLSYEMVFYLVLTALFVAGAHRRSGRFALGLAVAALALGGLLPETALSGGLLSTKLVAVLADLLIIGGVALAVTRHKLPKTAGAVLAGGTAAALLVVNGQWVPPWEALSILALTFTGTVIYRAEQGLSTNRRAAAVTVAVFVLVIAAGLWWHNYSSGMSLAAELVWDRQLVATVAIAGITFAAGLACRRRRIPSILAWLGLISYSVYLVHPVLLTVYSHLPGTHGPHPFPIQLLLAAAFLVVLLGCCTAAYRFVEAPTQRLGRRLAGTLDSWFGPDGTPEEPGRFTSARAAAR